MDNKKFSRIFMPRASFYLWVIFVLLIVLSVFDWRVAVPGYILLAYLVYYNSRSYYIRQSEITKYIENLTFNINTVSKDTLLNFPMPLVVVELDGTIIWYNSPFRKIFEGENLLEKTITDYIQDLSPSSMSSGAVNFSRQVVIKERHYCVLGNFVQIEAKNDAEKYILMIYLIDNTELLEMKKKYADEKTAVGIFIIDNYDDLMQSMEDTRRPQMLAEIEKRVSQWTMPTEGILKKYERDKYLYLFESRHINEFVERKFDILDSIKEISLGNRIPVTLSLGFGLNGKSLVESFQFAAASIDLALARGGDQVTIKNGDNFSFFGGKTRELEKRTRVKARVIAYALRELIEQSSEVMIMGHENGDIDSLGSSLGLYRIARNKGKPACIVLNHSNPAIENVLAKIARFPEYGEMFIGRNEALDRISQKTLLVVADTHRPGFTECPELIKRAEQVVVIDHHRRGTDFIQDAVLTYQETYASSTCELVTEILQYVEERIKLTPVEAEALYAGIVLDTKNFTFKTGVRTFEAAAFLRRQGVDTISVRQLFQNDLNTYINRSNVVKDAEILNDNIAISVCPPHIKNCQLIAAQAADELLTLSGVVAAFVLGMVNNEVCISGRSLGDINVQVILEKLGGGGHLTVAGAQLAGVSLEDAKEKLKYAIIEYYEGISKDAKAQ